MTDGEVLFQAGPWTVTPNERGLPGLLHDDGYWLGEVIGSNDHSHLEHAAEKGWTISEFDDLLSAWCRAIELYPPDRLPSFVTPAWVARSVWLGIREARLAVA